MVGVSFLGEVGDTPHSPLIKNHENEGGSNGYDERQCFNPE